MIPKRLISLLRQNALSTSQQGDSTIIIFKPSDLGMKDISTDFAVARLIGYEGWAFPATNMVEAQRLGASMAQDSAGYGNRDYRNNERF